MNTSPRRLLVVGAGLLLAISMTACRSTAVAASTAALPVSFGCSSNVTEAPPPAPPAPAPAPIVEAPAPAPVPEPVPEPMPTRKVLRKN